MKFRENDFFKVDILQRVIKISFWYLEITHSSQHLTNKQKHFFLQFICFRIVIVPKRIDLNPIIYIIINDTSLKILTFQNPLPNLNQMSNWQGQHLGLQTQLASQLELYRYQPSGHWQILLEVEVFHQKNWHLLLKYRRKKIDQIKYFVRNGSVSIFFTSSTVEFHFLQNVKSLRF